MSTGAGRADQPLGEQRRLEVMTVAEELVAVHGFDALRLRDVAKRAGVSIGLIQHYFGTRDELLLETMRHASARRAREWSELADAASQPSDRLAMLLNGAIGEPRRCAVWLETCAAAARHPELLPDVRRTQQAWRDTLRAAIEQGVAEAAFVPTISVDDAVELLMGLIDGLMLATVVEGGDDASQHQRVRLLQDSARRLLPAPMGRR